MSDLERFKSWVAGFEGMPAEFSIDYTHNVPGTGAIFPNGMVEVARRQNLLGETTVTNQLNFALYYAFHKNEGDDATAKLNAEWVMAFQRWVQAQSVAGLAPVFGNVDTGDEAIKAQNGSYYEPPDSGVGLYYVIVTVQYKTYYGG